MARIEQSLCKIIVLIHEGIVRTLQEVLVLFAVSGEVSAVPMEDGTSLLPVVGGTDFLCCSGVSHTDGTLKLRRSFQRLQQPLLALDWYPIQAIRMLRKVAQASAGVRTFGVDVNKDAQFHSPRFQDGGRFCVFDCQDGEPSSVLQP